MGAYWQPEGFYQLGEGRYADIRAESLLRLMYDAVGVDGMSGFADWLGLRESCVSDARRRGIMPVKWLLAVILKDPSPDLINMIARQKRQ